MECWKNRHLHVSWYLGRQSVTLGIAQIVCGIVLVIFQFIANDNKPENAVPVAILEDWYQAAPGLWIGALFVLSGGVGIAAGKYKTHYMIMTFMVSSVVFGMIFALGLVGWVSTAIHYTTSSTTTTCDNGLICNTKRPVQTGAMCMCLLVGLVYYTIMQWVLVITSMALFCRTSTKNRSAIKMLSKSLNEHSQIPNYCKKQDLSTTEVKELELVLEQSRSLLV